MDKGKFLMFKNLKENCDISMANISRLVLIARSLIGSQLWFDINLKTEDQFIDFISKELNKIRKNPQYKVQDTRILDKKYQEQLDKIKDSDYDKLDNN